MRKRKIDLGYLSSLAISILIALVIGGILMAITGFNPLKGYGAMLTGAFGSWRVFGNTMAKTLTIMLTALATAVGARAGVFNVGGEGQLWFGGLAATMVGVWCYGLPPVLAVILAMGAAIVVGGIYALIPALLKVKLNVSEVITTIMLNSVAIYVCTYLVNSSGPLKTTDSNVLAGSDAVPAAFQFGKLIPRSNLSAALIYSALIAFFVWYVMTRTSTGLEMKLTGENPRFSYFVGMPRDKLMIWSMMASGAICGLVGMFEVYGIQNRFTENISSDYYFDGMLVAMIMNYDPLGIILISIFFGALKIGASAMELKMGISGEIADIVFAIIIFLMAANGGISKMLAERRARRLAREKIGKEAG